MAFLKHIVAVLLFMLAWITGGAYLEALDPHPALYMFYGGLLGCLFTNAIWAMD